MGKWKTVFTNKVTGNEETRGEAKKRQKVVNKLLKTTVSKTAVELKEAADASFKEKKAREESIKSAYAEKKLKSKNLIKEARKLMKSSDK